MQRTKKNKARVKWIKTEGGEGQEKMTAAQYQESAALGALQATCWCTLPAPPVNMGVPTNLGAKPESLFL